MKKMMMMLFAALLSTAAVQAQEGKQKHTPEQRAEMKTNRMKEELKLNDGQATRIKEINLKYAQQMKDAKAKHAANKEAMKADFKALRTQHNQELASVLTPEQKTKWEEQKKARKEQHGKKKGHHKGKFNGKAKGQYKDPGVAPAK